MKKGKWKGLDLVRTEATDSDAKEQGTPVAKEETPSARAAASASGSFRQSAPSPSGRRDPQSNLGRIRTRRVLRGPDGEMYDLTVQIPVWLVQLDEINQMFISDALKSGGYDVVKCTRLEQLSAQLDASEEPPRLLIIEARAVGQQTPFFRKMLLPRLQERNLPCLLTGVANETQEASFRRWYDGPLLVGGDIDALLLIVQELIGPGNQ